ncbi:uncharacterized protein LOC131177149 [Hevea brasiliensis]|uniref:uncharacterized protein LOC131177149 n=1 Tax=Hevea brasiliensis TaxID=3981 RepID=UPI0025CCA8FC|nr:uncharacterized protein LOC131177149 [Hevea brasiliensis]
MKASMSFVLGQHDETGRKERAIYYLSKKFTDYETRYTVLEKTCCALTWASKRLRHYMLNYTTMLIARMDPLKYLFEKPALTGRTARWQMLLSEFDIVKSERKWSWSSPFLHAILKLAKKAHIPIAVKLRFFCTNNIAEYSACITGASLKRPRLRIKKIDVYRDSSLIIFQTTGDWKTKDQKLIPYHHSIWKISA